MSANPVGWLLILFTVLNLLATDAGHYAVYCYRLAHRGLPLAPVAVLLVQMWVVYAGLVLLATRVLPSSAPVAVAAATLAAAALFNPLRRRVQQIVDRRFNRARYDAEQIAAVFAARLKDAVDLDSVRDDLAGTVHQALEPAHVSVWVSRQG